MTPPGGRRAEADRPRLTGRHQLLPWDPDLISLYETCMHGGVVDTVLNGRTPELIYPLVIVPWYRRTVILVVTDISGWVTYKKNFDI